MGYYTDIRGSIEGFTKEAFELIEADLEMNFENFGFNETDGTLEVDSYAKHYDIDGKGGILDRITFCMQPGTYGELNVVGEGYNDTSQIFFRGPTDADPYGSWIEKHAPVSFQENPFKPGPKVRIVYSDFTEEICYLKDAAESILQNFADGGGVIPESVENIETEETLFVQWSAKVTP